MEPKSVCGLKVLEVEPDAPLPEGVPSWAERYDVVEKPGLAPERRPWVIGAGALGTLGSAALLAFSTLATGPVAAVLVGSLIALLHGLAPGKTPVLTPSPHGRYLLVDDGVPQPLTPREESSLFAMKAIGVIVMLAGLGSLLTGDWEGGFAILLGWVFFSIGRDRGMEATDLPPASARFRELADPSRPLTEQELTAMPPQTLAPTSEDRDRLP